MLHHVTLHLARSKQFPQGSSRYGYDITAPLDAEGHLDQDEWAAKRAFCWVRRFWADEGEPRTVAGFARAKKPIPKANSVFRE